MSNNTEIAIKIEKGVADTLTRVIENQNEILLLGKENSKLLIKLFKEKEILK